MLRRIAPVLICAFSLPGWQEAPKPAPSAAQVSGDTVVATLNGRKFTADEIRNMVTAAGASVQSYYAKDPKQFLRDHAYYLALLDYAVKNGLDKQSPTKEQLEFGRLLVLTSAALTDAQNKVPVTPEEQKKFYADNKDQFRKATVRMIYLPFAEGQAEGNTAKKAAAIAKRAQAGEDFEKLFKENSPDAAGSAPQLAITPQAAQPPQAMKDAIFRLKQGEVSEALRHENGYYVFRVESANVLSYDDVRDDIYKTIQQARFQQWQAQLRAKTTVQFENEAFFQQSAPQQ